MIGPDSSGNLLEVIVLVLADDQMIAIHAMKLHRPFLGKAIPSVQEDAPTTAASADQLLELARLLLAK